MVVGPGVQLEGPVAATWPSVMPPARAATEARSLGLPPDPSAWAPGEAATSAVTTRQEAGTTERGGPGGGGEGRGDEGGGGVHGGGGVPPPKVSRHGEARNPAHRRSSVSRTSGSAMSSISLILPSVTTKPNATLSLPSGDQAAPA